MIGTTPNPATAIAAIRAAALPKASPSILGMTAFFIGFRRGAMAIATDYILS
jgi:hypothetical protein